MLQSCGVLHQLQGADDEEDAEQQIGIYEQ